MAEASGPTDIVALTSEAGIGVEDLEQEFRECDLCELAHLCYPWELIGHHLQLKEADISAIKDDYNSAELQRLKMLKKWRDTNLRPTYRVLIDAFLRCGKIRQALVICEKVRQLNSEGSSTHQVRARPYNVSSVQMSQYSSVGTVGSLAAAPDHTVHTSLEESIRDLELKFSDVQRQFMRADGVTLIELKDCIATLPSFKPGTCGSPPPILSSSSVNEFFFYLKEYCNIQSHDILDDLIKVLGNDKTKKKMSDFKMEYKAFQRRTKLKDFIGKYEGPMTTPPKYKELEIKLGDSWREKTLEDLENLLCQISLSKRWLLKRIEEGSLIVKYLVPDDENLLLGDKIIDYLRNQSVSYIWIDRKPVFTSEQRIDMYMYAGIHCPTAGGTDIHDVDRPTGTDINDVDCTTILNEGFFKAVMDEISPLKPKYFQLGRELGVPAYELETLTRQYGAVSIDQAFNDMVLLWLRGRSTRTWQALVRAVDSETGGSNHPLALEIAGRHRAGSKLSKKNYEGASQEFLRK